MTRQRGRRRVPLVFGAVSAALTFLVIGDVTTRFTAGTAAGFGVLIRGAGERTNASTRSRSETA